MLIERYLNSHFSDVHVNRAVGRLGAWKSWPTTRHLPPPARPVGLP